MLFVLLGGLLTGMAKISRTAADVSLFDREIEFCGEIIRKELGEILLDNSRVDYTFLGGNEFFAYTTTRDELLVRDSIPGGAKRVEWRYDPGERKLNLRTVTRLVTAGSELPPGIAQLFSRRAGRHRAFLLRRCGLVQGFRHFVGAAASQMHRSAFCDT